MHGLAIADHPLGPFRKHPLNPVMNSGHETTLFPFGKGVAAFAICDGMERNTIQYADDWVNFKIASIVELMPVAAGPFIPDAFTNAGEDWSRNHSILTRFDCDLSVDVHDDAMKGHYYRYGPAFHHKHKLSGQQLKRIQRETRN